MIKAVFFDWFNTLAHYNPTREELQGQALQEFGFQVSAQDIVRSLSMADRLYFEENAISPIRKRSPEERARIYTRYQQTILNEAGVNVATESDLFLKIMKRVRELSKGMSFTLFDDVLPTLKPLTERNLTLGLLTNLDRDMKPICDELGLEPYINLIVTSGEAGADKPNPPVFLAALERAGVEAAEAVHVGDQYKVDIIGAKGVGINPILIDRHDLYPEVNDCPRINTLTKLMEYL